MQEEAQTPKPKNKIGIPLEQLLELLKENDFDISSEKYIEASLILETLHPNDTPETLKNRLSAILCQTPEQQKKFGKYFNLIFQTKKQFTTPTSKNQTDKPKETNKKDYSFLLRAITILFASSLLILIVLLLIFMSSQSYFINQSSNNEYSSFFTVAYVFIFILVLFASSEFEFNRNFKLTYLILFIILSIGLLSFSLYQLLDLNSFVESLFIPFFNVLISIVGMIYTGIQTRKLLTQNRQIEITPPFNKRPDIPIPTSNLFSSSEMLEAHEYFLSAQAEEYNIQQIDLKKTFKKTLKKGGFIDIAYQQNTRQYEYLLLIDVQDKENHLLKLIDYIYQSSVEYRIPIQRYYYDNDPRICWKEDSKNIILHPSPENRKYEQLEDLYQPHQRLIVVGEAKQWVNTVYGGLYPWAEFLFDLWEEKALLSPNHISNWGYEEYTLSQNFSIASATFEGILSVLENFNAISDKEFEDWRKLGVDAQTLELNSKNLINDLNKYLDKNEELLHWVASLALYPDVYWELTLHLGKTLDPNLLNKQNLSKIAQLDWFQQGEIPEKARLQLIEILPEEKKNLIQQELIEILEKSDSIPNQDTYAYIKYKTNLLKFQIETSDDSVEQQELFKELKTLYNQSEIKDEVISSFIQNSNIPKAAKKTPNWLKNLYKRYIAAILALTLIISSTLIILILTLGWAVMEPWTYIGSTILLIFDVFFVIIHQLKREGIDNILTSIETTYNIKFIQKELQDLQQEKHPSYALDKDKNIIGLSMQNLNLNDLEFLRPLYKLQKLCLGNNDITDLTAIQNLKDLKVLDLNNNQLNKLSISFLNELSNLEELYIYDNPIQNIPQEVFNQPYFDEGFSDEFYKGNCLPLIQDWVEKIKNNLIEKVSNDESWGEKLYEIESTVSSVEYWEVQLDEDGFFIDVDIDSGSFIFDGASIYADLVLASSKDGIDESFNQPIEGMGQFEILENNDVFVTQIEAEFYLDKIPSNIKAALKIIQEAKEKQLTSIDLGNLGLTSLEDIPELFELKQLEVLQLSSSYYNWNNNIWIESKNTGEKNQITQTPTKLNKNLKQLTKLYLRGVGLENVVSLLGRFENQRLKVLDLSDNPFENKLRPLSTGTISRRFKLEELYLANTNLNGLPERFFQDNLQDTLKKLDLSNVKGIRSKDWSSIFKNFTQVEKLNLSNNSLTKLDFLINKKSLMSLDLRNNQIKEFTSEFLNNFPNLEELYLAGNSIENIPEEVFNQSYFDESFSDSFYKGNCLEEVKKYFRNQYINHPVIKRALIALENIDYPSYFDEMDGLEIPKELITRYQEFKALFINKKISVDFQEHLKVFTKVVESQLSEQNEENNISKTTQTKEKKRILFIAVNTESKKDLKALDNEMVYIQQHFEDFNLDILRQPNMSDLINKFPLERKDEHIYHIVHFSGHGNQEGIYIYDHEKRKSQLITSRAFRTLFQIPDKPELVIFNTSYSSNLAHTIQDLIPYIISTKTSISQEIALSFFNMFYRKLSKKSTIKEAFQEAIRAIGITGAFILYENKLAK